MSEKWICHRAVAENTNLAAECNHCGLSQEGQPRDFSSLLSAERLITEALRSELATLREKLDIAETVARSNKEQCIAYAEAIDQLQGSALAEPVVLRQELIDSMCMTWRHDFGLDAIDVDFENPFSSGMTELERNCLRQQMSQLVEHHGPSISTLYTTPPQSTEPLTEEELIKIAVEDEFLLFCAEDEFIEIARAIEHAHSIGRIKS